MPEERLLKISPQNLLRQKEAQLAASLKGPEGETNKKTEAVVVKKKSDSEVGKSKKGKEAIEESEAKTLVERPVRGTKRPGSGLEVAIREVRLDMPRMKRLKSRTTSESSQSSREEEEARVRRRPLRAAALPKVEELEKEVRKEVKKTTSKTKKPASALKSRGEFEEGSLGAEEEGRVGEFGREAAVELPAGLRRVLVDDHDLVNRQRKLLLLPARLSAAAFLEEWARQGRKRGRSSEVEEVCSGLTSYMDATLGTQLLYKFERIQYSDVMKEHPGAPMCHLYPPVLLLRLLTRLGPLLAAATPAPALAPLLAALAALATYADGRREEVFPRGDYGTASPEYHRRAL